MEAGVLILRFGFWFWFSPLRSDIRGPTTGSAPGRWTPPTDWKKRVASEAGWLSFEIEYLLDNPRLQLQDYSASL